MPALRAGIIEIQVAPLLSSQCSPICHPSAPLLSSKCPLLVIPVL
ncbi:MAG: hypothetical protein ACR5K9_06735 [Wolbachia sp.]